MFILSCFVRFSQPKESHATLEALSKMSADKRRQCYIGSRNGLDTLEREQQNGEGQFDDTKEDVEEEDSFGSDPGSKMVATAKLLEEETPR